MMAGRALLQEEAAVAEAAVADTAAVDTSFLLMSAYLVFFMQAGFAMLCAGSVRSKNTMNILLKNVLDACAGAIAFYIFGFGVAYGVGGKDNHFIGTGNFGLDGFTDWGSFLFQWAFAATAATIVAGSVAERTQFVAYLVYSVSLTALIYPVVVHWVWSTEGWLSAFNTLDDEPLFGIGMVDFAGCGVVHMVGGLAGLAGAYICGPRLGRFDSEGNALPMPGHSAPLVVLGTFILWFGWYGFNPGSMLLIAGAENAVARTAVTTTLAAAAGGVTTLGIKYYTDGIWDLISVCNGLLAGLVAVTSSCSVIEPWAALICGFTGAFVYVGATKLLLKLRIDDPLEAAPLHGFTGAWGVIFPGLLAKKEFMAESYGNDSSYGIFYGGNGKLLGANIVGIIAITAWVLPTIGTVFFCLNKAGKLRIPTEEEETGLDLSHHGGQAYEIQMAAKTDAPADAAAEV